jgi:hypothetical protein
MQNVKMVRRAEFLQGLNSWVAIEVSSGAVELYAYDFDTGLEMFAGYLTDKAIPGSLRLAACEALYGQRAISTYACGAVLTYVDPQQLDFGDLYSERVIEGDPTTTAWVTRNPEAVDVG